MPYVPSPLFGCWKFCVVQPVLQSFERSLWLETHVLHRGRDIFVRLLCSFQGELENFARNFCCVRCFVSGCDSAQIIYI